MNNLHALVLDDAVLEYRNYAPNVDQSTLAPGKPRMWPVVEENATYDDVSQVREGPVVIVEPVQVIHRYTVRAKTQAEVDNMRAEKLFDLRQEEFVRISKVLSQGEQFAMTTGGFEGILNHGTDRALWPAGLRNQFDPLFTKASTECKSIHQVYNTKRNEINALTTPAQIDAYDVTTGWPS